jgi:glutathione S-transferase
MLKLHTVPGTCSTACHIVLEESGLTFETKILSFDKGDTEKPEFLKLNSMGAVPVLEIQNEVGLSEGVAIMQYIADQKIDQNLFPVKGMDHYRGLEWMNFIATELHKGCYGALFGSEHFIKDEKACAEFDHNMRTSLHSKLEVVNKKLEGKTWCLGNQFTIVDAYLFTIVGWSKHVEVDLTNYRNITAFQSRVFERPAVQRAYKKEGLI